MMAFTILLSIVKGAHAKADADKEAVATGKLHELMVTVSAIVQPCASVTRRLYVPGVNPDIESVVSPVLQA